MKWNNCMDKIWYEWIYNPAYADIKRVGLKGLQKIYKFGDWCMVPLSERPYALYVIKVINDLIERGEITGNIVEVGCGIGAIIGNIRGGKRYGYDIAEERVRCAKLLYTRTHFTYGSFGNVDVGNIDCVIIVGLMHAISYEQLYEWINELLRKNKVKFFVIESFTHNAGTCYTYSHDGNYLFDNKYKQVLKRGFSAAQGARRYIEVWKVKDRM